MAEANSLNRSNTSATTHFGRKPDETCSIAIKIEDIVEKIKTAEQDECLESKLIEHGDMKFKLKIFPNPKINSQDGFIQIDVNVHNPKKRKWNKIEVLFAESAAGVFLKTWPMLPGKIDNCLSERFGIRSFQSHDKVLSDENAAYFPGGVLTVKAIISICGEETVTHTLSKLPEKSTTPALITKRLTGDFKSMLENSSFSDFRIICQGEVIPCHRSVLSSRSEIFGAMLEHNMKETRESETGQVEINDFDFKTMKAVILYMYTGEVKFSEGNAEQLLRDADKYSLEELKNAIKDALIEGVKIENAIDMFVLGDTVHADKLRDTSKDIIVRNAMAIMKIDGWKEALGRFQDLTLEILESVFC